MTHEDPVVADTPPTADLLPEGSEPERALRSPSDLFFDDVGIGDSWLTSRRTITAADVTGFAGISGDFNPLHVDALYATEHGFGRPVAHGLLVLSVATGLRQQLGLFRQATKALIELRSWQFVAPVFPGDTLQVRTEITAVRRTSSGNAGVVDQLVEVRNQDGATVQAGTLVALIRRRAGA